MLSAAAGVGFGVAVPPWVAAATPRQARVAECAQRAGLAEQAIVARHLRPVWGLPGTLLGVRAWPPSVPDEAFEEWDYWFQAHLLDCAIDAALRAPTAERADRVSALVRGIRARNITGWTNQHYYDDMAWLLLALERADRLLGIRFTDGINTLRAALAQGWHPQVGAVRWRVGFDYYNACTNGPAGIALARLGELSRASALAEFLDTRLRDNTTDLIRDGVHEPGGQIEPAVVSYNQGTAIGLETELASRTGGVEHRRRATRLIAATSAGLTDNGVIVGGGGHDSGLFNGILARYLALAAITLGDTTAAHIVRTCAHSAWQHRAEVEGLPLFGANWSRQATRPESTADPARELSVQLSGWLLLEADYQLAAAGF